MRPRDAYTKVKEEVDRAFLNHAPFRSSHEGYAVILEELDELWEAVRKARNFKDRNQEMETEAVHVAAMAIRFLVDLL